MKRFIVKRREIKMVHICLKNRICRLTMVEMQTTDAPLPNLRLESKQKTQKTEKTKQMNIYKKSVSDL